MCRPFPCPARPRAGGVRGSAPRRGRGGGGLHVAAAADALTQVVGLRPCACAKGGAVGLHTPADASKDGGAFAEGRGGSGPGPRGGPAPLPRGRRRRRAATGHAERRRGEPEGRGPPSESVTGRGRKRHRTRPVKASQDAAPLLKASETLLKASQTLRKGPRAPLGPEAPPATEALARDREGARVPPPAQCRRRVAG